MRKVKPIVVGALCLWFCHSLYAVGEIDDPGPRASGLGGAGVALAGDAWAGIRNCALAVHSTRQWGGSWSQQFGLPELSHEQGSGCFRVGTSAMAVNVRSFGSEDYRESGIGVGLAHEFRGQYAAGVDLHYLRVESTVDPGGVLYASLGFVIEPLTDLRVGGVWRKIGGPRVSGFQDRLAESLVAGLVYEARERGSVVVDVVQDERFPLELRAGVEIEARREIALRFGTRTNPVRPSGGVGIGLKSWNFSYGFDLHPELGVSHSAGLEFSARP